MVICLDRVGEKYSVDVKNNPTHSSQQPDLENVKRRGCFKNIKAGLKVVRIVTDGKCEWVDLF